MQINIELAYDYVVGQKVSEIQTKVLETFCKFTPDVPHVGSIHIKVVEGPSLMSKTIS